MDEHSYIDRSSNIYIMYVYTHIYEHIRYNQPVSLSTTDCAET